MRVVLQRSKEAQVVVDDQVTGQIAFGIVLLIGITHEDAAEDIEYLVKKIPHLRIFEDASGKMNDSLLDVGGSILSISQFTLYGDTRKGRRPNFMTAAKPVQAEVLYNQFNQRLIESGVHVETGVFGEMMDVSLTNDGPVTLILDTDDRK
ncbi:D-tyrosyl-tRNA(Tyr) deacylase [Halolactibacillus halophilus]|uniref:D-aminoacyl-tRNA deacylase n=1 Tax=Halolactibacillus halophilus TaxID=306540 RepID=A0A1I5KYN7_9BACI|nr:D-aminoacyl-tRNA deacylase [Halolactibacillus halophilus]GEM00560.1 D-aminoacyl-tRNA deacylase [Halolactibacillus halophilus]SFO90033.1 D-tyrosyl-tRNA(Tyr) deacylase [Halolactibacillus halophilus]